MRWLAYLHPAAMLAVLALGLLVLREGLRVRRNRLGGNPAGRIPPAGAAARHRRLGKVFVLLAGAGFASGLASMGWIRGEALFESVHAVLATAALVGFAAGGALGLWLERHPASSARAAHAIAAGGGLLVGLAAAIAGFAILP